MSIKSIKAWYNRQITFVRAAVKSICILIVSGLLTFAFWKIIYHWQIFSWDKYLNTAEYIAIWALLVAFMHLVTLAEAEDRLKDTDAKVDKSATRLDSLSSKLGELSDNVDTLSVDLSAKAFIERAYNYYTSAQKYIYACLRLWAIPYEWAVKYSQKFELHGDDDKYLDEKNDLVQALKSASMKASNVVFVGPVNICSLEGLLAFPGVLWRALVINALQKWYKTNQKFTVIKGYCFTPTLFYYTVVDDNVLIEKPQRFLGEDEFGTNIGENSALANQLAIPFLKSMKTPDWVPLNKCLDQLIRFLLVIQDRSTVQIRRSYVEDLIMEIYEKPNRKYEAYLAQKDEGKKALDQLHEHKGIDRGLITDLLCDYLTISNSFEYVGE